VIPQDMGCSIGSKDGSFNLIELIREAGSISANGYDLIPAKG
jgi:hypothetical protein